MHVNFILKVSKYLMFTNTIVSIRTLAERVFVSINATKTHNHVLEMNLYNRVTCRECFVIPQPTFKKPMINVQIPLFKTDGMIFARLCNFLLSILKWCILLIPWPHRICLIYICPCPQARVYVSGKSFMTMVSLLNIPAVCAFCNMFYKHKKHLEFQY